MPKSDKQDEKIGDKSKKETHFASHSSFRHDKCKLLIILKIKLY